MAQYVNPQYYSGPVPRLSELKAADGMAWQAGQFIKITDSGVVDCATDAVIIHGIAAKSQATTSSSKVWVHLIDSPETKFIIGVTSSGADEAAGLSIIGKSLGLAVNSSICTLSLSNDSHEALHVHDVMGRVEPFKNDTNDEPGYAIVSVLASVLTGDA
jgi:hypothetical protein